ncbi:MAG: EAL domain-containing protein [Raoultibacter sp.]
MLVVVPCCVALVLQGFIYYFGLAHTGSVQQMEADSYSLFTGRVTSRAEYLENLMVQRWSNIGTAAAAIERSANQVLAEYGTTPAALATGDAVSVALVDASADTLIECLRATETSGAFFVVKDKGPANPEADSIQTGLYVRDFNPTENYGNNSDLLLGRCPLALAKRLNLALDSNWAPNCLFAASDGLENNFYYEPLRAAAQYPEAQSSDLGYWARPHDFADNGQASITYSVPLKTSSGEVFGVLGVEVALDRVMALFPYEELDSQGTGSYLLAIAHPVVEGTPEDEGLPVGDAPRTYEMLDGRGGSYGSYTSTGNLLFDARLDEVGRMHLDSSSKDMMAYASKLSLYGENSPYAKDSWVVVGLDTRQALFSSAQWLSRSLLVSFAVSVAVGLAFAVLMGVVLTAKFSSFMQQVRNRRPNGEVVFTPTKVLELDELAGAIEALSADVTSSASRLEQIMALSDRRIGAFEYDVTTETIFYAGSFFDLLGVDNFPDFPADIDRASMDAGTLDAASLERLFKAYKPFMQPSADRASTWIIDVPHTQRIVRFRLTDGKQARHVFGLLEDVTEEVSARRRIEHERDHDILTGLLNRRAFERSAEELLEEARCKNLSALMFMLDLDGLKFINDSYGHDWGDGYITRAGELIYAAVASLGLASRVSGDEFLVLVAGEQEIIAQVAVDLQAAFATKFFDTPDGQHMRVRASMGSACFPEDATDYMRLREYADFAMYTAKNTRKGELCAFSLGLYQQKSHLLSKKEDLNRLLDEVLVDYYFQPIVSARTGEVFGYEALMRPRLLSLPSPDLVLELARSQSKLHRVEQITFFEALRTYERFGMADSLRLFVNTIGTQCLSEEDIATLSARYPVLLKHLVAEITESEYGRGFLERKREAMEMWGGSFAIDDFGTGYNGDSILLENVADFVKIDMSIIANISHDYDRQAIVVNLLDYAHTRDIKVIAEGVETEEQLGTLIELGVDYVQGYLTGKATARPQPENPAICALIRALNERCLP